MSLSGFYIHVNWSVSLMEVRIISMLFAMLHATYIPLCRLNFTRIEKQYLLLKEIKSSLWRNTTGGLCVCV